MEGCGRSSSGELQQWSRSEKIVDDLFTFYIECDGSDHHRAMRSLLDAVIQLLKSHPDAESARAQKQKMLTLLVSIINGTNTKPVAKVALKTLDWFLVKDFVTLEELETTFRACRRPSSATETETSGANGGLWRSIFADVFHWMHLYVVFQATGKLIGTLYRGLRSREGGEALDIKNWLGWLAAFLEEDVTMLEPTKRYLFLPLFKTDPAEALKILQVVLEQDTLIAEDNDVSLDVPSLLRLSIIESGKKVGIVDEPGKISSSSSAVTLETDTMSSIGLGTPTKKGHSIMLDGGIVTSVLCHPSRDVRGLALSILITSPSSTKPYSREALSLLRNHIGPFLADPDAKFRGDVMSRVKEMFKRVRGAICLLTRSLAKAEVEARKKASGRPGEGNGKQQKYRQSHFNVLVVSEEELKDTLHYHDDFIRWFLEFLRDELVPTASYQRHYASLKALSFIIYMEAVDKAKDWGTENDQEYFFDRFDGTWARALFDLIMDPFEDVRELTSSSIKILAGDARFRRFSLRDGESKIADEIALLSRRADDMARQTSRADHSDGAARACQLVYLFAGSNENRIKLFTDLVSGLEGKVSMASRDLGAAVLEAPVHGDFAALGYIWQVVSETELDKDEVETVSRLQERVVACCEGVWEAVQHILCDDSPEGHLPQELEEQDGLDTKDVISYSFRAVHESSNVMRHMALSIRNRSNTKAGQALLAFPSEESFERIGNLSFLQLSTLRHRGAFSTVSQTFSTCCQQSKHLEAKGENLLLTWYKGTMAAIQAQASTTRRSAGIPSLMTGILSANAASPAFDQVMSELMAVAGAEAHVRETDGSKLPQVHAFNCLKDIFKSAFLTANGNKSDRYLPQCLELAATALRSEVWAIRNCGLILLRSLIDSFLGTNYSKAMIEAGWDGKANRIAYHRYPTLPVVLLNLLKSGHSHMMAAKATESFGAESVFPALDIIRRGGPPDAFRSELETHIAEYLASPVWLVREMAARTLCSCLLHDGWLDALKGLLEGALEAAGRESSVALNRVHGVLLAIKFVLERHIEVAPDRLPAKLSPLADTLQQAQLDEKFGHCPEIQAAYLHVVNLILSYQLRYPGGTSSNTLIITNQLFPSVPSGSALLNIQLVLFKLYPLANDRVPSKRLRQVLTGHVNAVVPALELLPALFPLSSTSDETLADLSAFYMSFTLSTSDGQLQSIALENMADILDHLVAKRGRLDLVTDLPFPTLWAHLPPHSMAPMLSQATTRASGCIVAILSRQGAVTPDGLRLWGLLMAEAGRDDKVSLSHPFSYDLC